MASVPYCCQTADLAAEHNSHFPNPARSVLELLDLRAETHGDRLAVGFPENRDDSSAPWKSVDFSASSVASLRLIAQRSLSSRGPVSIWPSV